MKKGISIILSAILLFSTAVLLPAQKGLSVSAGAAVTGFSDRMTVGIKGSYYANINDAIKRINNIRYEACKEGVRNPSNPSKKLSLSDYHEIKWSAALERVARLRATESILFISHTRPNGEMCFTLDDDEVGSMYEVLAWNYSKDMVQGLNQFYEEKKDWVNQTAGVTGHYEAMIDPECYYVGLGGFYSDDCGYYRSCLCGRFAPNYSDVDETRGKATGVITVPVEVQTSIIKNPHIRSLTQSSFTVSAGSKIKLEFAANDGNSYNNLIFTENVIWSSSDPSVAFVDNTGTVNAMAGGTATIKAVTDNGYQASTKVTVKIAAPKISKIENTTDGVKVTWNKVAGAEKYRLYRKTGSGLWQKVGDTTSLSGLNKAVKSGTKYTYTVRCISKDAKSFTSDYDKTGKSITYIAAPKITTLENTASGVKITWSKVTGAAKYRLFRKTGSDGWKKVGDTTSTSCVNKAVTSGTKYTYTIRCVSKDGKSFTSAYYSSGWSKQFIATPAKPALKNTSSGVQVSWKKIAGAEKYRVYRKTSSTGWKKMADTESVSYVDKSVKASTTYYYTIRCISKDAKSFTSSYNATGSSIKTPAKSSSGNASSGSLSFSYTKSVSRGSNATVTVKGAPNTSYSIKVVYKSGPSTAAGLTTKTSDANGKVSWTWKVGQKTTPGSYPITVSGGGKSGTVYFTVT